jgi:hypothetical protein
LIPLEALVMQLIKTIWQEGDKLHKLVNVPGCRVIIAKTALPGHIRAIMIYGENVAFTHKYKSELKALAAAETRLSEYVRVAMAA